MQPVERVRHVHDAALAFDLGDGLGEAHAGRDAFFQEEADDLALAGLDLFAHDDAHAVALGEGLRLEGAGDLVVIGDGQHVEAYLGRALKDLFDRHGAVLGVARVHVKVGEQLGLEVASRHRTAAQAPADDVAVELHDLVCDDVPAVAAHALETARGAGVAQRRVAQQALEPGAQGAGVAGRYQQPLDAVAHDVAIALDV